MGVFVLLESIHLGVVGFEKLLLLCEELERCGVLLEAGLESGGFLVREAAIVEIQGARAVLVCSLGISVSSPGLVTFGECWGHWGVLDDS